MKDEHGNTPLHRAAELGLVQICRFLIANGADVTVKNANNSTAMDIATPTASKAIREEPIKGNSDIESQVLETAKNGDLEALKVCIIKMCMFYLSINLCYVWAYQQCFLKYR